MNQEATSNTPVRLILTGGTIDKVHNEHGECLDFDGDTSTRITELLKQGRCFFPSLEILLMKDSLHFDDKDRQAIRDAVSRSKEDAIVVTHGTGTMGKTARFLDRQIKNKTVVLTGALRPFSLGTSDASFNIGGAVAAAQILENGVWAVMNGRIFPASKIMKDIETGRFDL